MKWYRAWLIIVISLLAIGKSSAQADTTRIRWRDVTKGDAYGYYFTVPLESPFVDFADMNDYLAAAGLPVCKLPAIVPGIGIQVNLGRVIIAGAYNRLTRRPKADTVALAVSYRAVSLNVGYDVLNTPRWSLFPYLGLKACKTNYRYDQKTADTPSIGGYLQTNLDHKELTNDMWHGDFGLGIMHQSFCMFQLRAGILLPMGKSLWYINNNKVPIGLSPGFRYQGYVTLTLGVGEFSYGRQQRRGRERERAEQINYTRLRQ